MNRKLGSNKWTTEIICIAFILAGAWLFIYGLAELNRAGKSPDWPSVKGKVIRLLMDEGALGVTYTYEIDGRTFEGNHVGFGQKEIMSSHSRTNSRLRRQYPEGKAVDVYYDPNDLKISVLEPGIRPGTYSMPGFGLFFMLVNGGALFWFRRMRRRHLGPDSAAQREP